MSEPTSEPLNRQEPPSDHEYEREVDAAHEAMLDTFAGVDQPEASEPTRGFSFPMDPESNWDICPVCIGFLHTLEEFPGIETMRNHHESHKAVP